MFLHDELTCCMQPQDVYCHCVPEHYASSAADIPTIGLTAAKADATAISRRGVFKLPAILRLENGLKVALGGTKVPIADFGLTVNSLTSHSR